MSRVVGVDIRDNHVRVASLKTKYRAIELEALEEELLSHHSTSAEAIAACMSRLPAGTIDSIVALQDGERTFFQKVILPMSAKKRIAELLPFELEAALPLEMHELLVDFSVLPGRGEADEELVVLALAARLESLQEVIAVAEKGTGREPERIGCSTTELVQLATHVPALNTSECVALVDLGFRRTDVCILRSGQILQPRALSLGVEGFPDSAPACVARLRQTFSAFAASSGQRVEKVFLLGEGTQMPELDAFLQAQLELPVSILPPLEIALVPEGVKEQVPTYGRALAAAFHGVRGKGFDLRQGPLSFERGYEHVKEKAPLFAGLAAALCLSFLFSVWAESRALASEYEALSESLGEITLSTFGEKIEDPDEAEAELAKARKSRKEDPMPYLDGFGVAVVLAETIPDAKELTHDVEEFEVAKGKLKLRGLVSSAEDAQKIAQNLAKHRCIIDPKVSKISQVVNSDRERYVLEALVQCPEDQAKGKKGKRGKKSKKAGGK